MDSQFTFFFAGEISNSPTISSIESSTFAISETNGLKASTSPDLITSSLVEALGEQLKVGSQSRSDNVMENIKEMITLCLELLNSDNLHRVTYVAFAALAKFTVLHHGARREFQDQVIECLREANIRFPPSLYLLFSLAELLKLRFFEDGFANDDDNEGIAILNRAMTLASDLPDDTEGSRSIVKYCLLAIASISFYRSRLFGNPEY
jgi:hypothetical protein